MAPTPISYVGINHSIYLLFLKKWTNPGLFFVFIFVFSNKYYKFYNKYECEKCPSSIRHRDSNSQPSDNESPPLTPRPGLPHETTYFVNCFLNERSNHRNFLKENLKLDNLTSIRVQKIKWEILKIFVGNGEQSKKTINPSWTLKKTLIKWIRNQLTGVQQNRGGTVYTMEELVTHDIEIPGSNPGLGADIVCQ